MTRGGRAKDRSEPERRCIATGERHPSRGLIRFVLDDEGRVVADVAGKLPGRGLWVTSERRALEKAVAKGDFARAARKRVDVPEGLVETVETLLLRRVQDRLSMARKAGLAIAGFEKVKDWLNKEQAVILFQATDGSARGKDKLRPPRGRGSFFEVLSAGELGLSFAREHVIHAALAAGGLTDKLREDAVRLSGVRERGGGHAAPGKDKTTT